MKNTLSTTLKGLVPVAAALAMLSNPVAHAESTYGAGISSAPVSANAQLKLSVVVPKVIALRVGPLGAGIETVSIMASASNYPFATGNNLPASAMPIPNSSSANDVVASAWTNASGGGDLSYVFSTAFSSTSNLSGSSIDVASTVVAGNGLAHPVTNMGATGTTTFTPNILHTSTWKYSLNSAAYASMTAGTHTATIAYTATSL